jgi:glycosyltransferase involved in cell wall biosynthesis
LPDQNARLFVAGKCKSKDLKDFLLFKSAQESRITFTFKNVPPEEVQVYFQAADLAVFNYKNINFSGAAILALTFAKPVLAPRIGSMPELQEEFGEDHVMLYDHPLTTAVLKDAMIWAKKPKPQPTFKPEWNFDYIVRQTERAYISKPENEKS